MIPIVLLHGFLGQPEAWDEVAAAVRTRAPHARIVAPRLPGHGPDAAPSPGSWDAAVDAVAAELPDGRALVAGYSNGGRLALGLLARHPDRIAGLVLVSAHLGLADGEARAARAAEDDRLATLATHEGMAALIAAHRARPVLAGQSWLPPAVREALDARRHRHHPAAVAAALRDHGLGAMPDLRRALAATRVPVTAIAGGDDARYAGLARGRVVVVPAVGHDVVLEAPQRVADAIVDVLLRVEGRDDPAAARPGASEARR